MKTSILTSLALAVLAGATPLLSAQEPPAVAEAPAAFSPEALAGGRELLALTQELTAIVQSDKSSAEKAAAIHALTPRATAFAQAYAHIGKKQLRAAARSLVPEDEGQALMAQGPLDKEVRDAMRELERSMDSAQVSGEAMQVARDFVQLQMEVCDIVLSDKPDADKLTAIKALHPRATELGERGRPIVGNNEMVELGTPLDAALDAIYTEEHGKQFAAAQQAAEGKRELMDACEEVTDIVFRGWLRDTEPKAIGPALTKVSTEEDAAPAKPEAHELLADDIIRFMMDICTIVEAEKPTAEKVAEMAALKPRAAELGRYLRSMGRDKVGRAAAERSSPEDAERFDRMGDRLESDAALKAAYEELSEVLMAGTDVVPTAEATQVAEGTLALAGDMAGILTAGKGGEEARAALEALLPRAAALGEAVRKAGTANVRRATQRILEERGETEFEPLNRYRGELADLLEKLAMLSRGEPVWIPNDTPAEQVAADFLALLREGVTRMKAAESPQALLDVIEELQPRAYVFLNWAMASKHGKEVAAILDKSPEFAELGKEYSFLHNFHEQGDNPGISAQLYMQLLANIIDQFHAGAAAGYAEEEE